MPKLLHLSAQERRVFIVEMNAPTLNQRRCSVDGCKMQEKARGFCSTHYNRVWKYGTVNLPRRDTPEQRLMSRVSTTKENGCWEWQGYRDDNGYGNISYLGQIKLTHRVSACLFKGFDIDSPLQILHHCDNPPCVNPDHLFIGTPKDNMQDALQKGRLTKARGEQVASSVLTAAEVLEIRKLRSSGSRLVDLAKKYGVGKSAIWHICSRKTWRHLPEDAQ